jgi:hypothetical protein
MIDNVIQFVPRPNPDRAELTFEQKASFYESVLKYPKGSFRGEHQGIPFFELPDTSPSEYSAPDGDCA